MKSHSLTRNLTLGVLAAELLCVGLFAIVAIEHEMHERHQAFDIMLDGHADSLLGAVQDAENPADDVTVDKTELVLPPKDAYEVIMANGRIIGHSTQSSPAIIAVLAAHSGYGYFNFTVNQRHYRGLRKPGIRVIDRDDTPGGIRRPVTLLYAAPTAQLWHQAVDAIRFYLITGILLLLLTGTLIALFLRRSLLPLRELADSAARVSSTAWQFTPPDAALHTRELEPITSSIQTLLHGLQQSFERQRQFTGDAAHELKTSIAILKSRLQLLAMRERTSQEYWLAVEELLLDTQRMEQLTHRMLVLARAEHAPRPVEIGDLTPVLLATVARLEPSLKLYRVVLTVQTLDGMMVTMPTDDIDVLCSNLFMNAIQHSREEALVSVKMMRKDSVAVFTVADEGEGIAAEALPHIFDRFYRADTARSRTTGGAGLGLAICKAIVDRAGGSIAIASIPGEGTQVEVSIPLAPECEIAATQIAAATP